MASEKTRARPPDHASELARLNKVMGQIAGIEKMILAKRYCPEIIQQVRAACSALKAVEVNLVRGHLAGCIKTAAKSDSQADFDRKLKELLDLIRN